MPCRTAIIESELKPIWRKVAEDLLRFLACRKVHQPCLLRAELGHMLLRFLDPLGDYRINVILTFYCTGDKGHAWLTRSGKPVLSRDKHLTDTNRYIVVGQNKKYIYYIKERNLYNWYNFDIPECLAKNSLPEKTN